MTFYWWSHWFWITLLGNILLTITFVQTYPSQEISLEYNQNSKTVKTVTKLYQTTTTLTWATATATATPPNSPNFFGVTAEKTILQSVTPEMIKGDNDPDNVADEDEEAEELIVQTDEEQELEDIDDVSSKADQVDVDNRDDDASDDELEFKRSADNYNNTDGVNKKTEQSDQNEESGKKVEDSNGKNQEAIDEQDAEGSSAKLKREENNNYTNFSKTENSVSTNSTNNNNNTSPSRSSVDADASKTTGTASLLSVPAAPKITGSTTHSVPDWFNALAQLPPTDTEDNVDSESVTVAHKIPFTLENVNKEEELRRAENEHRSRKSKVLSADYKHINRFINFSADSKSLLTRSASSAPTEFDGDEGNISSEALAIQRTYFLDAGAISAICFTIFGVCCTVGTIGIVLYRRRYLNKPQTLSEPDSSVYIDDSTMRVSDNSDEMYSLDNDSFLNSLEAMTIQNYWTDTVKHTKL